jgi:multidrug efflux pump subunit AcrA (membrane-fusion protein)
MTSHHANEETFQLESAAPCLRLCATPLWVRSVARIITIFFLCIPFLLIFVPWMQTATGKGRVVADSPLERQQELKAPLDGIVVDFYGHREGSHVQKGDPVFRMADNDPQLPQRLASQVDELRRKVAFSEQKVDAFDNQMDLLTIALDSAIQSAEAGIETANAKVTAFDRSVDSAKATLDAAKQIFERVKQLTIEQLASTQELELAERDLRKAEADAAKAVADLQGAQTDLKGKVADLEQKRLEGRAKIEEARSKREQASSELTSARKELSELETKSAQIGTQLVTAPFDGVIFRILRSTDSDFVKKGDPVVALVPNTDDPAVELWVDGNDAPLVSARKAHETKLGEKLHVRLQFEGWPAVQFAGWPSVAVGTFGGLVKLMDATDDGYGRFRVLVVPDPNDQPWPSGLYLRQGVRANGWILLNQVPLGWEVWRKLNGFPPAIPEEKMGSKQDDSILKKKK